MKKKLLVLSTAIICMAIAVSGTYAYFTAKETARNVITAGNIKIELVETAIPEGGGDPVPFENVDGVMPGAEISKIAQVRNTGDNPAYVRVSVEKVIELAEGIDAAANPDHLILDINTSDWTYQDGFYYYNKALPAGMMTEPLFTTVTFDKSMDNRYKNSKAVIAVTAYATQVANNGTSPLECKGWPEE